MKTPLTAQDFGDCLVIFDADDNSIARLDLSGSNRVVTDLERERAELIVRAVNSHAEDAGRVEDGDPRTGAITRRYDSFYDGENAAKAVCDIIEHLEATVEQSRQRIEELNTLYARTCQAVIDLQRERDDAESRVASLEQRIDVR